MCKNSKFQTSYICPNRILHSSTSKKKKGEKLYKKKEEGPLFSDVQTKKLEPASGNQGKNKRRSRDSTLKLKA
jgi:hypothetical protein